MKDDVYKCYPHAKLGHLKTGGNFPFLSRIEEVNIHILVSSQISHNNCVLLTWVLKNKRTKKKYVSITYHFVLQIHLRNFEQGIWFHPEYSSVRESYTAIISQQYNQNRKYFSTDWVLYIMSNNQLSKFIVLLKIKYLKHIFLLEINIVLILWSDADGPR